MYCFQCQGQCLSGFKRSVCSVSLLERNELFVEIIAQGVLIFEYLGGGENSGISLISPFPL